VLEIASFELVEDSSYQDCASGADGIAVRDRAAKSARFLQDKRAFSK